MSLRLVGKTGAEVLVHRHEPLQNLHVLMVGRHVLLGDIVADAHQQVHGLNITSGSLLGTFFLEESPTGPSCCCTHHGLARPMP